MKKIKNIVLVLSMLTLSVSLFGCADNTGGTSDSKIKLYDDSNSYENPNDKFSETNAPGVKTEGKMNEKTAFKDLDINLTKVVLLGELSESTNCYASVFEITNNSNEDMEISALADFTVQIDDGDVLGGRSMESEAMASEKLSDIEVITTTIKSKETVTGYITFKNPRDWKTLKICYVPEDDNESKDAVVYNVTPDMITES